jgi:hypothetical protein
MSTPYDVSLGACFQERLERYIILRIATLAPNWLLGGPILQLRTTKYFYLESNLETGLRVLGEDHPDTLTSTNNLASTWF